MRLAMATRKLKKKQARAPRGQVGPQTYEQVRKIADEKKIPLVKAFAEVAKATGRKASTVAVTYYRVARKQGGPTRKGRGRRAGSRGPGRPRAGVVSAGPRIRTALSRVSSAIKELEAAIASQAEEIARLRSESGLADRIRKALRE
jgi:hypothetical protein